MKYIAPLILLWLTFPFFSKAQIQAFLQEGKTATISTSLTEVINRQLEYVETTNAQRITLGEIQFFLKDNRRWLILRLSDYGIVPESKRKKELVLFEVLVSGTVDLLQANNLLYLKKGNQFIYLGNPNIGLSVDRTMVSPLWNTVKDCSEFTSTEISGMNINTVSIRNLVEDYNITCGTLEYVQKSHGIFSIGVHGQYNFVDYLVEEAIPFSYFPYPGDVDIQMINYGATFNYRFSQSRGSLGVEGALLFSNLRYEDERTVKNNTFYTRNYTTKLSFTRFSPSVQGYYSYYLSGKKRSRLDFGAGFRYNLVFNLVGQHTLVTSDPPFPFFDFNRFYTLSSYPQVGNSSFDVFLEGMLLVNNRIALKAALNRGLAGYFGSRNEDLTYFTIGVGIYFPVKQEKEIRN